MGLFSSPDEVRAALRQQDTANAMTMANMPRGRGPVFAMGQAGGMLGNAVQGMLGYEDPQVKKAKAARQAWIDTETWAEKNGIYLDSNPEEYMATAHAMLGKYGLFDLQQEIVKQLDEIKKTKAASTNASANMLEAQTRAQEARSKADRELKLRSRLAEIHGMIYGDKEVSSPISFTRDENGNLVATPMENIGERGADVAYAATLATDPDPDVAKIGADILGKINAAMGSKREIREMGVEGRPDMRRLALVDKTTGKFAYVGPEYKQGALVNVGLTQEKALSAEVGRVQAKRYERMLEQSDAADEILDTTAHLKALSQAGMFTGTGADAVEWGVTLAETLGVPVNRERLANTASFKSEVMNIVLKKAKALGTGNGFTDKDREFLMSMLPQAYQSPAARDAIIERLEMVARRAKAKFKSYAGALQKQGVDSRAVLESEVPVNEIEWEDAEYRYKQDAEGNVFRMKK